MESLFPELPEDLSILSDEELADLKQKITADAERIEDEDEEFLQGMDAAEVLANYELAVEQLEEIDKDEKRRKTAEDDYLAGKAELAERRKALAAEAEVEAEEDDGEGGDGEGGDGEAVVEAELSDEAAEDDDGEGGGDGEGVVEEDGAVLVAAAETVVSTAPRQLRRPPAPRGDRIPDGKAAVLTAASGIDGVRGGQVLDRMGLAEAMRTVARRLGPPSKSEAGIEQRFFIGQASFPFPDDRRLYPGEIDANARKIQAVIPNSIPGVPGSQALTASGGLCAPLENVYTMPNFASTARPVRDSLPSFQAERGGVNVPTATTIGDITTAISIIEEWEDAAGGSVGTKSCQDLTCPAYTETAVTVISHCREYGNLNARAWPEKIAHENDLTMAAHARSAESYLLDRIKAQCINVTSSTTLGAFVDLVDAIVRAQSGIEYRLRMNPGSNFRVLLPSWVPNLLVDDTIRTQYAERFAAAGRVAQLLSAYNITPTYYLDTVATGTSQGFAAETASALDPFPTDVQFAIYPEGTFIHIDGGMLDLGLVRDSTLNSTNDFQIFGETFENVARIGPAQAALWVVLTTAPTGQFPVLV